ncbi:hypothetical protein ACK31J_19095, partial [Aeromonas caviae]
QKRVIDQNGRSPSSTENSKIRCGMTVQYNVFLNDGRKFMAVELVGSTTIDDGQFSFAGWEGMLVLKQANSKRIFLKQSAVRYIEEL